MSRLISFAVVVVLCICVVSSDPVFTTPYSTLDHEGSAETDSENSNPLTQTSVNSSSTPPPPPTFPPVPPNNTHADHNAHDTDTEHSVSPNSGSTTTGSTTTMGSTAIRRTTTIRGTTFAGLKTNDAGRGAGIFFLIFIILIIGVLATILYILWKKGKRYSFDLKNCEHDTPLRSIEQTGTFEPTKGSSMNLDFIPEENPNSSPVPNGCSGETPEKTPCSEQQHVSEDDSSGSDSSRNSPVKKVEFNLDLELIGADLEAAKGASEEPADKGNENNNNDTNAGSDSAELFIEINLDDLQ